MNYQTQWLNLVYSSLNSTIFSGTFYQWSTVDMKLIHEIAQESWLELDTAQESRSRHPAFCIFVDKTTDTMTSGELQVGDYVIPMWLLLSYPVNVLPWMRKECSDAPLMCYTLTQLCHYLSPLATSLRRKGESLAHQSFIKLSRSTTLSRHCHSFVQFGGILRNAVAQSCSPLDQDVLFNFGQSDLCLPRALTTAALRVNELAPKRYLSWFQEDFRFETNDSVTSSW